MTKEGLDAIEATEGYFFKHYLYILSLNDNNTQNNFKLIFSNKDI